MTSIIAQTKRISMEDLWNATSTHNRPFNPKVLTSLPTVARHYLERAITPGKPLASAVRLWMHGHIKLKEKWHSFQGEEVICWERGLIWRATTCVLDAGLKCPAL